MKATRQFLNDQVNDRLKSALGDATSTEVPDVELATAVTSREVVETDVVNDGIETTLEELEGFQIVRAIVCSEVKPSRVVYRDAKSYFAIFLDDNNRKPLARLHFNRAQKYLGLFDENKVETKFQLGALDEIYDFADALRHTVKYYD